MSDYQLHLGDCLDVMRQMPDESVDVVITDPPYGIRITRHTNTYGVARDKGRRATNEDWDDAVPAKEYFDEMRRVGRHQIVFGANYFMEFLPSSKCYVVWDKRGNLPDVPFSPVELAWTSFDRLPRRYIVRNHGFIRDSRERREHPTQKPLLLMQKIIEDFTSPGNIIFDPFMGSGTTGVAAIQAGRRFIGCEINPGYFEIAQRRIAEAAQQPLLPEAQA